MKLTRYLMREAAHRVLEGCGDSITLKPGAGITPGARLIAVSSSKPPRTVGVRTSFERGLGLARDKNGRWRISDVDEVLVAVPTDDKTSVEVMSFDPKLLIDIFNDLLNQKPNLKKDYRLPVFMPLDTKRLRSTGAIIPGLKEKSIWRKIMKPDEEMLRKSAEQSSARSFIERVKREFAEINGVDVSKVTVHFGITD